jgi:cellulose synthase/poly-beta-1,6-N-acetylglucosamine synthase-like glycosyltransferase
MNGGKADSLNLGLNAATKEFFCGIDADSLLEPDALLKAVSVMLDYQVESIATGGNICPVNGCSVELGSLDETTLPNKFLPRLQSLEYLRSFMSGRVGWAHMNLLLIISGAFGIFQRERTIRTGGYLTKKGKYKKDTVGEDMELVVRLSRFMKEQHKSYRVQYAFNANCWTEVPETWKVLHRQRDRWHRGLIDILLFHSTMIGNPRYGKLGLVAMPYYFVFEFIGPFIEVQGLAMVGIAALIGALNFQMALLLFTTTILLGILVSVSSVFISEFDREMYRSKDVARLLYMAVVENFGIRQIISLWRVTAFFSAMRKNRGWGAQVRKGFKKTQNLPKVSSVQMKKQ